MKTPGPTCSTSATGSSLTVGVQHPDTTLSTHTRNCTILKTARVDDSFLRVTELAQEANPSDHPRASTLFLNKSQTDGQYSPSHHLQVLYFFHPLIEFFSTRCSAREKEKQLLESCKCSSEALCLKCVVSLQSCAFFFFFFKLSCLLSQMSPGLLSKKYSSCSTIFIDDSTVSQPNLKSTIKW